jgi:hypothetical protein
MCVQRVRTMRGGVPAAADAASPRKRNATANAAEGNLGGFCVCNSLLRLPAMFPGCRPTLWFGCNAKRQRGFPDQFLRTVIDARQQNGLGSEKLQGAS